MKNTENRIDQLFESTRTEAPIRSFESSKEAFIAGLETTTPTGILAKWAKISFTFKTLIMLGIIGATATLITCLLPNSSSHEKLKPLDPTPYTETTEVVDYVNEVVVKTIYFDTEKQWAEIRVEPTKVDISDSNRKESNKNLDIPLPPPVFIKTEDSTQAYRKTTTKCFSIEKNSSDLEIERIRKLAEAAGLHFRYKVIVWRGKIKRCSLHICLDKDNEPSCEYDVNLSGKFWKKIQWVEDENGKAISFEL
ncbi:MAG: hypothetical protein ACJA1C_000065 [Crocinitomicaceae bacterium]|jgi:hypothetical protein